MLVIRFTDILRATLPVRSGNEGWFGAAPRGDAYHVVVPVDAQIARGVMAGNRPNDGTPFGGYSQWIYFRCEPYEGSDTDEAEDRSLREGQARRTADRLIRELAAYDIEARVEAPAEAPSEARADEREETGDRKRPFAECPQCGRTWASLGEFLRDDAVVFRGYRAATDDFSRGTFAFIHECGTLIEITASKLVRRKSPKKSLAGLHSCPGMCNYESSMGVCSADCDGAVYLRVARKLGGAR